MAIVTDCPKCGKEFTLPDELMGRRIKCKACNGVFRVGAGGESPAQTGDEFEAFNVSAETHTDAPAVGDDDGGTWRDMPGVGESPPGPSAPDEFSTQWGGQDQTQRGDEFATSSPDDFATQTPPTKQDFSDTVPPAGDQPVSMGDTARDASMDEVQGDTWDGEGGDTWDGVKASGYFSGDTAADYQDETEPGAIDASSGDTVSDTQTGDSGDTVSDALPGDDSGDTVSDTQSGDSGDTVSDALPRDDVHDIEVSDDFVDDAEKIAAEAEAMVDEGDSEDESAPKLPGKAKLPGGGKFPGKGATLPGKAKLPGKGPTLPGKGLPSKDSPVGKKLPAKAGKPGEIGASDKKEKKKGGGLLVKFLLLFLLLDIVALALLVYVPEARERVGLTGQPWLNEIAKNVGGYVDDESSDDVADTPADGSEDTPEPDEPDTPAPDEPEPDTPEPDTPEPDEPEPDTPEPDEPEPDEPEPDTPEPDTPEPDVPEPDVPEPDVPEPDVPEPDVPEPDIPEPDVPEPDIPEPDEPEPLPEATPDKPEPEEDPFKSEWPTYERPTPKKAEPGKAKDFFDENFDNPRYDWDWLPNGVSLEKGKPGVPGALKVKPNKQFHLSGDVKNARVSLQVWRDVNQTDEDITGASAKGYEVHFRWKSDLNYHALQIRNDGYYRVVKRSGRKTTVLVGDGNDDYLPIPRWDRGSQFDEVTVICQGDLVAASFNGLRLTSTRDADDAGGKVGFRTLNNLTAEIEAMSVDEVGEAPKQPEPEDKSETTKETEG